MTAPVIPTAPEELQEFMNDDKRWGTVVAALAAGDNQPFQQFMGNYADAFMAKHADLDKQVREMAQAELREFLVKNGADITGKLDMTDLAKAKGLKAGSLTNRDKGQRYNPKAAGARLDKQFVDHAEFFQAAYHRRQSLPNAAELEKKVAAYHKAISEIRNAAGSTVPSDGGFLIPEILRSEILQLALETAIARPHATVIPMDSLSVPIPAVDEISRVNSIFGGIQFYWSAEGSAGIDTSAKFTQVMLTAKKLFGYAGIPNELAADAPAFMAWFAAKFPMGIGWFEDLGFLGGDGTDKPLGVTNAPGRVNVTRNTANEILYTDITQMYSQMYPASIRNGRWIASIDAFPQLAQLSFTPAGGSTPVPVMLWQMNAIGEPVASLLGRPIDFTEKVGPLGSVGDLMFVDWTEYLIGDRQAMSLESSADYLFGTDKTAFRIIERVDGQPWVKSPLTPHNNSSHQLSPYVVLN